MDGDLWGEERASYTDWQQERAKWTGHPDFLKALPEYGWTIFFEDDKVTLCVNIGRTEMTITGAWTEEGLLIDGEIPDSWEIDGGWIFV